jgi:hypothetical protein
MLKPLFSPEQSLDEISIKFSYGFMTTSADTPPIAPVASNGNYWQRIAMKEMGT